MSRLSALTMPAVTEPPNPNGLPIAITGSPTRIARLSPNPTTGNGFTALTFSTARSAIGLEPSRAARNVVLSCNVTLIISASLITCALVTMMPLGSMMNPDPRLRRGSAGAGAAASEAPCCSGASGIWVLKIFTTAGNNFGTSSSIPRTGSPAVAGAISTGSNIARHTMAMRDISRPPDNRGATKR